MSANTLHLKPASGLLVRHPEDMRELAAAGEHVPDNGYWQRRLRDGDCVLVAAEATTTEPASKAKPTTKAGEA
jgi:hypothetical protein